MMNVRNLRRVVKGFLHTKDLICLIILVLLLLNVCITVDYAANDNDTISNINESEKTIRNCTMMKNIHYDTTVLNKTENTVKGFGKVHHVYPEISMWAKPSVRSGYAYRWYKKTFIDYCPHCHHYGVLLKNPKGVPEREYTCRRCGADYCAVTGKEKYSWSRYYLRRA